MGGFQKSGGWGKGLFTNPILRLVNQLRTFRSYFGASVDQKTQKTFSMGVF